MGVYTKTITKTVTLDGQVDGYSLDFEVNITASEKEQGWTSYINLYATVPNACQLSTDLGHQLGVTLMGKIANGSFADFMGINPTDRVATSILIPNNALEYSYPYNDDNITFVLNKAGRYLLGRMDLYLYDYPDYFSVYPYANSIYPVAYNGDPMSKVVLTNRYTDRVIFKNENETVISSISGIDAVIINEYIDIPALYMPVKITAPTTYLGEDMNIAVTKKSGYSYSITYTFGDLVGTVTEETTQTSITWDIPTEDFLAQFSGTEIRKDGILSVRSIYNNEVIFTDNVPFIILLDSSAGKPTISPTIKDTNSTTIALTGNANKLVKYYSNAQVTTGAKAQGAATITSVKTVCGSKSFTGLSGTISAPDSNVFIITATDSRGLTSSYTETLDSSRFVNYSKLSCNLFTQPTTTDGKLTFTIEGNCYYGSFGATNNTLTVQYRYKTKDGTYSSWTNASATLSSSSNYSKTITLTGLDYRTIYVIQARAIDKLATIQTSEVFSVGEPIFDWSKEDFNFNVPVTAGDSLFLPNGEGIFGTAADGTEVSSFNPCDTSNNTVIGYGSYQNEIGSTKIYGSSSVDIFSNGDITFNGQSLLGLIKAMSNSYTFTTTVTPGSNYNSASCALTLRGNCLYCRIYGSRAGASGTGDITDELIGKVSFNHGGKITGMDYVGAISSQTGTAASIAMKNPSVSGNTATFDAYLTNSATAGTNFMATFVIPVSLNLNNF